MTGESECDVTEELLRNLNDGVHGHRSRDGRFVLDGVTFFFVGDNAWLDVTEDGNDENVNGKHEQAAFHRHHQLLPGQRERP